MNRKHSIAKVSWEKNYKKHLLSSFPGKKSGSVIADRIELVKKTELELVLLECSSCFSDGYGNYDSNLTTFNTIFLKNQPFSAAQRNLYKNNGSGKTNYHCRKPKPDCFNSDKDEKHLKLSNKHMPSNQKNFFFFIPSSILFGIKNTPRNNNSVATWNQTLNKAFYNTSDFD